MSRFKRRHVQHYLVGAVRKRLHERACSLNAMYGRVISVLQLFLLGSRVFLERLEPDVFGACELQHQHIAKQIESDGLSLTQNIIAWSRISNEILSLIDNVTPQAESR